jgi:hypothetical protein
MSRLGKAGYIESDLQYEKKANGNQSPFHAVELLSQRMTDGQPFFRKQIKTTVSDCLSWLRL